MLLLTSVDRGRLAHQTSPHYVRSGNNYCR
jgi:hypothetical protein